MEVRPGKITEITVPSPQPDIGTEQLQALRSINIVTRDGYMYPSEALTAVTKAKLASLLAFAGFAAVAPRQGMSKLKKMGVIPFSQLGENEAGILFLLGVGGKYPRYGIDTRDFLRGAQLELQQLDNGSTIVGRFEVLSGFPYAAEWRTRLGSSSIIAKLDTPGFVSTHYAIQTLQNRVTVIVMVVEEGGEIAVEQFLFPTEAVYHKSGVREYLDRAFSPGTGSAKTLQRLELAQRFYISGQALPLDTIQGLYYNKWVDPLLGCLAGYSLVDAGDSNPFRDIGFERYALKNMLKFFGELPDTHVLAGLYQPEHRESHFTHAAELGIPVFSAGFRHLHSWFIEQGDRLPKYLSKPASGLIETSPWTAWTN